MWPDDALKSVADQALSELPALSDDALKASLSEQCMQFHRTTRLLSERYRKEARRHFYVTPTSYLQLLESFKSLLTRRQNEAEAARRYVSKTAKCACVSGGSVGYI